MSLNKTKEVLKNEINELEYKISSLNTEIKQLTEQKKELEKNYQTILTEENTKNVLEKVFSIDETNVIEEWIGKCTKTIPIIDEFCKSKKAYLILDTAMQYDTDDLLDIRTDACVEYYISYIIIKQFPRIYYKHDFTITELKNFKHNFTLTELNNDLKPEHFNFGYFNDTKSKNLYNELKDALREYFVTTNNEGVNIVKPNIDFSKAKIDIPLKNIILLRA